MICQSSLVGASSRALKEPHVNEILNNSCKLWTRGMYDFCSPLTSKRSHNGTCLIFESNCERSECAVVLLKKKEKTKPVGYAKFCIVMNTWCRTSTHFWNYRYTHKWIKFTSAEQSEKWMMKEYCFLIFIKFLEDHFEFWISLES